MVFLKHYFVENQNELIYEIISYSLMGGEEGIRALALGLLGEPTPPWIYFAS